MIKAIFIDYTGTMVKEDEPYTRELLAYFLKHSDFKSTEEALSVIWKIVKDIEAQSFGDAFIVNDEKADRILQYCVEHHHLQGDLDYIHETWRKIWVHAPLYEDVKPFFERSTLPIYVITNDDLCYIEESMRIKDLHPAGIISADMVKACKPSRLIFEKALETAGVKPEEAMHIGDSMTSDVEPAGQLGITPVYISRNRETELDGIRVIRTLDELQI